MRVLVTGANGFVGRTLCQSLRGGGYEIREAARNHTGDGEIYAVGDIGPDTDWATALESVDSVVHLAARAHVMDEQAEDALAEYRRVNAAGTERLAREAAKTGARRMVYLSSIKLNGEATQGKPFTEEDAPDPHDPYAVSKREAEEALWRVSEETGLEVVVLRPPLVYGPGVKANFLALVRAVDRGVPLPLGSADNRRSLIYVANLADAIESCVSRPEAAGETFLVSDIESVSTPDLIRCVAHSLGKSPRLLPFPPGVLRAAGRATGREAAVERLLGSLEVDSSKVRRVLGWRPPYTMDEGLEATAAWFRRERR